MRSCDLAALRRRGERVFFIKKKVQPSGPQEEQAASCAQVLSDCVLTVSKLNVSSNRELAFYEVVPFAIGLHRQCEDFFKLIARLPSDEYLSKVYAAQCTSIIKFHGAMEEGINVRSEMLIDDIRRFVSMSGEQQDDKIIEMVLRFMAQEVRQLSNQVNNSTNEELLGIVAPLAGALYREATDFIKSHNGHFQDKGANGGHTQELSDVNGFLKIMKERIEDSERGIRQGVSEAWELRKGEA